MNKLFFSLLLITGLNLAGGISYAVTPKVGTTTGPVSLDVKVKGTVIGSDPLQCRISAEFKDQVLDLGNKPVWSDIPTNEQFAPASFPFYSSTNSAQINRATLPPLRDYGPYWIESSVFRFLCDDNANISMRLSIGPFKDQNKDASGLVQEDLLLDFLDVTGQNKLDFQNVFRLATFLFQTTGGSTNAYRLGIRSFPSAQGTFQIAPGVDTSFYLGFMLTRRTKNFDNNNDITWQPPADNSYSRFTADFPLTLTFN